MKLKRAAFWIFASIATIFFVYAGSIMWILWPIDSISVDKIGVFGDSFGVLTSLFSGLAFAGLILTVLLQRQELKESREIFKKQRFEDSFFRLLDSYRKNLLEVRITDHKTNDIYTGVDALSFLLKKLSATMQPFSKYLEDDEYVDVYAHNLFVEVQRILVWQSRYLGSLNSLLTLVENEIAECEEREFYWGVIASQLTSHEFKYIFYECLVAPKENTLRELIQKSSLIQRRLPNSNVSKNHIKIYNDIHKTSFEFVKKRSIRPFTFKRIRRLRKQFHEKEKMSRRKNQKTKGTPISQHLSSEQVTKACNG